MSTGQYTHDAALHRNAEQEHSISHEKRSLSSGVEAVGRELARHGLVVIVGWIGLLKFTAYEAEGIRLYVANSPLMSWVYGLMSVRDFSAALGIVEVSIALLIAARPFLPRASAFGSALAVGMFLTTLSFLVTTPGVWEPSAGGFPSPTRHRSGSVVSKNASPCRRSRARATDRVVMAVHSLVARSLTVSLPRIRGRAKIVHDPNIRVTSPSWCPYVWRGRTGCTADDIGGGSGNR
jgi:reactive chlorine resistance protein C